MQNPTSTRFALTLGLITAAFGLGRLSPSSPGTVGANSEVGGAREAISPQRDALTVARDLSEAFSSLSERVGPSVVQVRAFRRSRGYTRSLQDGSGVVVRSDGVIVTNGHVVRGANSLRVVFNDGSSAEAELVGADHETDVAILRVKGEESYASIPLNDSVQARVGQIVLAMGNPMGLGHTVTQGIIAGTGRSDLNITTYEDFLQTDAVINPGNSGGPLINLDGEVLGINTAVGLASNGDNGIAFAIPSRIVRKVLQDILAEGRVLRGWIGIETRGRRQRSSTPADFDGISRVRIQSFRENSPGREAGLEEGDIIVRVANRRMVTNRDFLNVIAEHAPGSTVSIEVWRDGEELALDVELAERRIAETED